MQSLNCVIFVHSSNFIVLFFCFTAKCEYLFGLFVLSHNLYSYSYYSWNLLPSLAQFLTMPLFLNHTLLILQFFLLVCVCKFLCEILEGCSPDGCSFLFTLFWTIFCYVSPVQAHFNCQTSFLDLRLGKCPIVSALSILLLLLVCLLLIFLKIRFCTQTGRPYLLSQNRWCHFVGKTLVCSILRVEGPK